MRKPEVFVEAPGLGDGLLIPRQTGTAIASRRRRRSRASLSTVLAVALLGVVLVILSACGAPAPEDEDFAATDEPMVAEDLEGAMEEEAEELEIPPDDALPLSAILVRLESTDIGRILEVEFEDGTWEVEYVVDGEERELRVDPMTGEVLPEPPDEEDTSE